MLIIHNVRMSGGPDYKAYQNYLDNGLSGPVTLFDGGAAGHADDHIIVDYDKFRHAPDAQIDSYVALFNKAVQGRYESDVTAELKLDIADVRKGVGVLAANGGGLNHTDQGVLMFDTKTASYVQNAANVLGFEIKASPLEEKLFDEFMIEHEVAHSLLDLEEGGADFVASTRLLQKFPGAETETFLNNMADMRVLNFYRAKPDEDGQLPVAYGHGCYEAIKNAISLKGENMGIEDMHDNAQIYDRMNGSSGKVEYEGFKGRVSAEMIVRNALLDVDPTLTDKEYKVGSMDSAAKKVLGSGKFEIGTKMHDILEDIGDASKRMDVTAASRIVTSPSMAPAAQMQLQAVQP